MGYAPPALAMREDFGPARAVGLYLVRATSVVREHSLLQLELHHALIVQLGLTGLPAVEIHLPVAPHAKLGNTLLLWVQRLLKIAHLVLFVLPEPSGPIALDPLLATAPLAPPTIAAQQATALPSHTQSRPALLADSCPPSPHPPPTGCARNAPLENTRWACLLQHRAPTVSQAPLLPPWEPQRLQTAQAVSLESTPR